MKTIVFATTNIAKVRRINSLIDEKEIHLLSLGDLRVCIPEPKENGADGEENARIKASYYFKKINGKFPVLTQDDTLHLCGVSGPDNPGKDIKLPVIKKFGDASDDNIISYYTDLAKKYGGKISIEFRYGHALATSKGIFTSRSKLSGWLVSEPNNRRTPSYPIADIMAVNIGGKKKYWSDLKAEELIKQDSDVSRSIKRLFKHL